MNYNDMAIFAAVVESGSFTAAAKTLDMPKSTISQRLSLLEQRLGIRLLHRSTRSQQLTGPGEVYFKFCQQIVQSGNQAHMALGDLKETPKGKLRIAAPEAVALYLLPGLLHRFKERFPFIQVGMIVTDKPVNLANQELDFGFAIGKLDEPSVVTQTIGHVDQVMVASPDYLNRFSRPEHPKELNHHRCMMHRTAPSWLLKSSRGLSTFRPKQDLASNNLSFILNTCIAGAGIALLPEYVCSDKLRSGELESVLPEWKVPSQPLHLFYSNRDQQSTAQQKLIDHVATDEALNSIRSKVSAPAAASQPADQVDEEYPAEA